MFGSGVGLVVKAGSLDELLKNQRVLVLVDFGGVEVLVNEDLSG